MKNQFSSSIYLNGYIYGFDNKNFQCIDAKTGQSVWRRGGFGHGSLTYVDGHFVVLGDNGRLALVEVSPRGLRRGGHRPGGRRQTLDRAHLRRWRALRAQRRKPDRPGSALSRRAAQPFPERAT